MTVFVCNGRVNVGTWKQHATGVPCLILPQYQSRGEGGKVPMATMRHNMRCIRRRCIVVCLKAQVFQQINGCLQCSPIAVMHRSEVCSHLFFLCKFVVWPLLNSSYPQCIKN